MLGVPRHILHHPEVPRVDVLGVHRLLALTQRALHVPQADLRVVGSRQQVTLAERRPAQAVPLGFMSLEAKVGSAAALCRGLGGVSRVVEHVHVSADGLRTGSSPLIPHPRDTPTLILRLDLFFLSISLVHT